MDGCGAIYPAIAAVFIAQYFGIELTLTQYVLIGLTAVLGSLGTAGVPGTSIVMLTLVLSTVNLPLEGIAYIIAIDRVIDMMRTATNVTGQMLVPVLVAKEERILDQDIYDGRVAWRQRSRTPGPSASLRPGPEAKSSPRSAGRIGVQRESPDPLPSRQAALHGVGAGRKSRKKKGRLMQPPLPVFRLYAL
jgi:hypothetical protein